MTEGQPDGNHSPPAAARPGKSVGRGRVSGYNEDVSAVSELVDDETPPGPGSGSGRPHRILTVSADMGAGHNATATALEELASRLWPGSEIRRVDALDVMGPGVGRLFRAIYVANVESTPWLYEFFYSSLWRQRWFASASKRFTGSWCGRRLAREIDRFDPSLVLSTYPLGSSGLAWLRRHRGLSVPAGAWVSDFSPHPFWVYDDLDVNVVMHEAAAAVARAAAPGAAVQVSAPPVPGRFRPGDRDAARGRLGLRPDGFVVLVSCGAYAFGEVDRTVRAAVDASDQVQVVAVCGRDELVHRRLRDWGLPQERLLPLGWTDEMPTLLQAADLVLTNAGGATVLEALACACPVLMYRPIAAHGQANADLMAMSGLAELCTDEAELGNRLRSLIRDPGQLDELRRNARAHVAAHELSGGLRALADPPDPPAATRTQPAGAGGWPMRPADAFFAHVQTDAGTRQEMGAVLELADPAGAPPLTLERMRRGLADRAAGLPPVLRRSAGVRRPSWRLTAAPDALSWVTTCTDEEVVDGPGMGPLYDAIDRFWSETMPAPGQTWQFRLVRSRNGDRCLIGVKLHHTQGDGISALGLLDRLLDADPDDPLIERGRTSGTAGPAARSGRPASPRATRLAPLIGRGLVSLATRGRPPRHRLNTVPQGAERRFAGVPLPFDRLRTAARALDAHPHELALAVVADALGRLLVPAGLADSGRPMRAMIPVAMRAPRMDRIFGNWTGSVALDLPIDPALSPRQRIDRVKSQLRLRAARGEPHAAQAVLQTAGLLPVGLHRAFARLVYSRRFFSTIVSYMPGARHARWFQGRRVRAVYPVLPVAAGVPLTVGLVIADGTAGFGVFWDPVLGLERPAVSAALTAAFEQLTAAPGDVAGAQP